MNEQSRIHEPTMASCDLNLCMKPEFCLRQLAPNSMQQGNKSIAIETPAIGFLGGWRHGPSAIEFDFLEHAVRLGAGDDAARHVLKSTEMFAEPVTLCCIGGPTSPACRAWPRRS